MTAFRYEAAENSGRIRTGVLDADSPRLARAGLRQQGLTPLTVEALSASLGASNLARLDGEGNQADAANGARESGRGLRRRL